MRPLLATLALSSILLACQPENRVYAEHEELSPNVEWLKKDARTFSVPIADTSATYRMSLSFRYAVGYQYGTADVKVTETSPSGAETVNAYTLKVREPNGDYIGEPGYDIWDSEHVVEPSKRYSEIGTYTYVMEQNTPVDPLNYAMEIGLILDTIGE